MSKNKKSKFIKATTFGKKISSIKLFFFQMKWHRKHKGNPGIVPQNIFPEENVIIGKSSYGNLRVMTMSKLKLYIGNYVSIGEDTTFVLDMEHPINHVSTFPFKNMILKESEPEAFGKGNIVVEDDVWIGYRSTIMSGVRIGQGAVVAAGSIVTKDVEPYAIVGGIPAKLIKYRFDEKTRSELLKIDYSKLTEEAIRENMDIIYRDINAENIDKIVNCLKEGCK